MFKYAEILSDGLNTCVNGDCGLPGETEVVDSGCYGSVSVFTVDYSAPSGSEDSAVREKVAGIAAFGVPEGTERRRKLGKRGYEMGARRRHD